MTGKGKASNNHARQMKSAGRGGGEAREGRYVASRDLGRPGGVGNRPVNQRRAAPPYVATRRGGNRGVRPWSVRQQR